MINALVSLFLALSMLSPSLSKQPIEGTSIVAKEVMPMSTITTSPSSTPSIAETKEKKIKELKDLISSYEGAISQFEFLIGVMQKGPSGKDDPGIPGVRETIARNQADMAEAKRQLAELTAP